MLMFATVSHGAGLLTVISRLFPSTRAQIFREERERKELGFSAVPELAHLVGREGVIEADARPVGKARFGSEVVSVVSEDEYLPRGASVRGMAVRGGTLLVRRDAGA